MNLDVVKELMFTKVSGVRHVPGVTPHSLAAQVVGTLEGFNTVEQLFIVRTESNAFLNCSSVTRFKEAKKKRELVPWKLETCPGIPFVVRSHREGGEFLVAGKTHNYVIVATECISYEKLLTYYSLPDGSPCGVKS